MRTLIWLYFAALLLHQFEEYVYPGRFKIFFNHYVWNKNRITRFPLNDRGIFLVNVGLAWTFYALACIIGMRAVWLTLGLDMINVDLYESPLTMRYGDKLSDILQTISFNRVNWPSVTTGIRAH